MTCSHYGLHRAPTDYERRSGKWIRLKYHTRTTCPNARQIRAPVVSPLALIQGATLCRACAFCERAGCCLAAVVKPRTIEDGEA